ncbi:serine hydrolase [Stutzerimonas tarimensis]|uniref:beta-lactamase n=1 Tax=Stutzerimonas tarimensis TaxID=1507735 RepID=A0ABV7T3B2_9GAMM
MKTSSSAVSGCVAALLALYASAAPADWTQRLEADLQRIADESPGNLGIYIKHLGEDEEVSLNADRLWYLGSAAKVPIAVAVLQGVDDGDHALSDTLALRVEDKVDGSGQLVWQDPGVEYRIETLLTEMLIESDNTAANMLVRLIGEDSLNERTRENMGGRGVERITDFTQVRRDVYGELHPDARDLGNMDLVRIAAAPFSQPRYRAVANMLDVPTSELQAPSLEEAYDRYYARNINAASLEAYGRLLEKLVKGELLSESSLTKLYADMKIDSYDAYRLEAGLPSDVPFIQKTGTQLGQACHVGVIDPAAEDQATTVIVLACAEHLDENKEAGQAFELIGEAITRTVLRGMDD